MLLDGFGEADHDDDIGEGEEGFGAAVEPVYIGEFGVVDVSGIEARWNGDGDKHQQEGEAGLDKFGGLLRFGEEPQEAEVGEEGEGEEGFFGHGEEERGKKEERKKKEERRKKREEGG
jgi:hypothetical protein